MSAVLVAETKRVAPAQDVRFALVNDGPGRLSFGLDVDVQRAEGERWVDTDFGRHAVPAVALSLTAGKRFEQRVEIPVDAPLGRYRIRKRVEGAGEFLTCEFTVELSTGR